MAFLALLLLPGGGDAALGLGLVSGVFLAVLEGGLGVWFLDGTTTSQPASSPQSSADTDGVVVDVGLSSSRNWSNCAALELEVLTFTAAGAAWGEVIAACLGKEEGRDLERAALLGVAALSPSAEWQTTAILAEERCITSTTAFVPSNFGIDAIGTGWHRLCEEWHALHGACVL